MTTATQSRFWAWLAGPSAQAETGPERVSYPGPVFIHDAVVPWKDGTVLLDLMRKDAARAETDD